MAGQKIEIGTTTAGDGWLVGGLPLVKITENGNVEPDDEWALFRLTDEGYEWYQEGPDFAAGIMSLLINNQPAVKEIKRFATEKEAIEALVRLPVKERERILIRSVPPKK